MSKYIYVAVAALSILPLYALLLLFHHSHQQLHLSHSLTVVGCLYLVSILSYFFFPRLLVFMFGAWDARAIYAWCVCGISVSAISIIGIMQRNSTHTANDNKQTAHGERTIEILATHRHAWEEQQAQINTQTKKTKPEADVECAADLSFTPYGLPLLPSPVSSVTTSAASSSSSLPLPLPLPPVFTSPFAWRSVLSLCVLCVSMSLVPVMVINFSVCCLTLVCILPLLTATAAITPPSTWRDEYQRFAAACSSTRHGSQQWSQPSAAWEWSKFVWRKTAHVGTLIVYSPLTLFILLAHFHRLPLHYSSLPLLLHSFPRSHSNLLYYTFFFSYLPLYLCSLLLSLCHFRLHSPTAATDVASDAQAKKKN